MCGRGHAWQGGTCMAKWACMAGGGGMCGGGTCVAVGRGWQEKRQLQRAVRILLECILVDGCKGLICPTWLFRRWPVFRL